MSAVACERCEAVPEAADVYCRGCGWAIPFESSGLTMIGKGKLASTPAGRVVQLGEARRLVRTASRSLFAIGILQLAFLALLVVLFYTMSPTASGLSPVPLITMGSLACSFFVLGVWAWRSPLPATIVGLCLYISMWIVDIMIDPAALFRGILIRLIFIILLSRGVQAALNATRLEKLLSPEHPE